MRARALCLAVLVAVAAAFGCDDAPDTLSCSAEAARTQIEAVAGAIQSDGSVTVYGSVQFGGTPDAGDSPELTVRNVYVAGQPVVPASNGFNFRSWSVSIPRDVLTGYAGDGGRATLWVKAYLTNGCIVTLAAALEPVVTLASGDGGPSADAIAADAAEDAPAPDGATGGGGDGSLGDGPAE